MEPEDRGPLFETRVSEADDVVVIQTILRAACVLPEPVLDGIRRASREVDRFLAEGRRLFVIDLSSISWVDSACLGELVSISRQIRGSAGVLKVILNDRLMSLWKRMGLGQIVSACGNLDDAVADVKRSGQEKQPAT